MIRVILCLCVLFTACTKSNTLDSKVALKNVPDTFFTENTTQQITTNDSIFDFLNKYERLPNTEFSKFYLKKHPEKFAPYFNITLNINKDNKITFEGVEVYENEIIPSVKEFVDFASNGKKSLVHLNFEENSSLQTYVYFTKFMEQINTENISLNKQVYIYNLESLPNCDCSL